MRRSVAEAAGAMAGTVLGADGRKVFDGVSFDSRATHRGHLFFALRGERTDGHRFVGEALSRGAVAAVVERPGAGVAEGATLIRVESTFAALHALTRHVRDRVPKQLVGITGSAGKTTTKEILAALLATRFRVARNPGNLNNLYGFPLSLLNIPDDTEWMVAELGMSAPGELREISLLARPDVAVFTNVRPVHLEFFAGLREIAEAKSELLAGLAPGGLVVANADDPEVVRIVRRHGGPTVWYGVERPAEVAAREVSPAGGVEGGSRFLLVRRPPGGDEESVEVRLPLLGRHNLENFLAAAATAFSLGVGLAEIAAAAPALRPVAHRGEVHRLAGGVTLIDDSYNSNPAALSRVLEGCAAMPAKRRWAVLGDMLELGPEAPRYHREAGAEAARRGFAQVVGVGELAREIVRGAEAAGVPGRWFATSAEAVSWVVGEVGDGDLVLVKGSRGVGLDSVVAALLERRAGRREA